MSSLGNPPLLLDNRRALEWRKVDPRLAEIIERCFMVPSWPMNVVKVVSLYRTPEEEDAIERRTGRKTSRIHTVKDPFIRAGDIATVGWNTPEVTLCCNAANRLYVYDPERPHLKVAVYVPHGTGPHVHVQVHPNTRRRQS